MNTLKPQLSSLPSAWFSSHHLCTHVVTSASGLAGCGKTGMGSDRCGCVFIHTHVADTPPQKGTYTLYGEGFRPVLLGKANAHRMSHEYGGCRLPWMCFPERAGSCVCGVGTPAQFGKSGGKCESAHSWPRLNLSNSLSPPSLTVQEFVRKYVIYYTLKFR